MKRMLRQASANVASMIQVPIGSAGVLRWAASYLRHLDSCHRHSTGRAKLVLSQFSTMVVGISRRPCTERMGGPSRWSLNSGDDVIAKKERASETCIRWPGHRLEKGGKPSQQSPE
jgi:hypothetical protein